MGLWMAIYKVARVLCLAVFVLTSFGFCSSSFNRLVLLVDEVDEDKESGHTLRDLLSRVIDQQAACVLVSKNIFLAYLKVAPVAVAYRLFDIKGCQYVLIAPNDRSLDGFNLDELHDISTKLKLSTAKQSITKKFTHDLQKKGLASIALDKIFITNDKKLYWNICLFGHGEAGGRIAGTESSVIKKLFVFFNTQLNTNLVYISSCFLGGFNKTLLLPKPEQPYNFILALGSSSESRVVVDELAIRFNDFFNDAECSSMRNPYSLGKALDCLTYTEASDFSAHGLSAMPQLYDKKTNSFNPFIHNKKVVVMNAQTGMDAHGLRSGIKQKQKKGISHPSFPIVLEDKIGVLLMNEQYSQKLVISPASRDGAEYDGHLGLIPTLSSLLQSISMITPQLESKCPALKAVVADMPFVGSGKKVGQKKNRQILVSQGVIFPAFLSMSSNRRRVMEDFPLAVHYFQDITIVSLLDGKHSPFFGLARFLRDSFMDVFNRDSENYFLIKRLSGYNDFLPILEIFAYLDDTPLSDFGYALLTHKNKEIVLSDVVIRTQGLIETDEMLVEISFVFEGSCWHLDFRGRPEDFTIGWNWDFIQGDDIAKTHRFHKAKRYLSTKVN